MISRRQFIQRVGLLGGILLTPLGRLVRRYSQEPAEEEPQPEGELYAGFVLLPEGAKLPDFVLHPQTFLPDMCGVGRTQENYLSSDAVTKMHGSTQELTESAGFSLFMPTRLPADIEIGSIMSINTVSGNVSAVSLGFEKVNIETEERECVLSLWAQPDYYRPYPIWRQEPVGEDDLGVIPQKVDFLPAPGIMVVTQEGVVFLWISGSILYRLNIDPIPEGMDPKAIFADLGVQEVVG